MLILFETVNLVFSCQFSSFVPTGEIASWTLHCILNGLADRLQQGKDSGPSAGGPCL